MAKRTYRRRSPGKNLLSGKGLLGAKLGMGIIGAGSVVTKDIPAGEKWAGNPATKLKEASK